MEKFTSFEKVVGNISNKQKEHILKNKEKEFENQSPGDLEDMEREKTQEELQIIFIVNKYTNEILQEYGLDNFDIPSKNVHVVKKEKWTDEYGDAFYHTLAQGIVLQEQWSKLVFAKKVAHEMLHFKSYNALQITKDENRELKEYRLGMLIITRNGKQVYFENLNEAITEEITRRVVQKLSDNPLFFRDMKQTQLIKQKLPNARTSSGELLFNQDTFYAQMRNKNTIDTERFTRKREREILESLINKLIKLSNSFNSKEEVFKIFARAVLTGNIIPIGKLIDKTFGNGTFRKIGELDKDTEAQEKFVNSL